MTGRGAVMVTVAVFLALIPGPAAAHTRAGSATDWHSEITSAPELTGVTWRLYPTADYIEVTNDGDQDLTIRGYEGEPYLRIGPDGVRENLNSPATYLNSRRDGDVALPPNAVPSAEPDWRKVTDDTTFAWYDHRVHPMPEPWPTSSKWEVPFEFDGRELGLRGELTVDPGPQSWVPLLVGFGIVGVATLAVRSFVTDGLRAASVVVGCVALLNLAHIPDEFLALPAAAIDTAYGVMHNALFIGVALVCAFWIFTSRTTSALVLFVGSAGIALHQGFLQVGQLGTSQLPTVWPPALIRVAVATSLAQLVLVIGVGTARSTPEDGPMDPVTRAGWPSRADASLGQSEHDSRNREESYAG